MGGEQIALEEVAHLAAAVEAHSEHPLAAAVLNYAAACLGVDQKQEEAEPGKAGGRLGKPERAEGAPGRVRDVSWVRPASDVEVFPGTPSPASWIAAFRPHCMDLVHSINFVLARSLLLAPASLPACGLLCLLARSLAFSGPPMSPPLPPKRKNKGRHKASRFLLS